MVLIGVIGLILDTTIRSLEKLPSLRSGLWRIAMSRSVGLGVAVRTKLMTSGLDVSFDRGGATVKVLQNISLEISEGEFVCILGASGWGKSTLLNVIGGFWKPTAGQVMIDAEPVTGPDPRRIFVFQERGGQCCICG
jgi:ABC-type transport system involved in cytochrome bd biosynthesis fused ATPase/permease subunit